MSRRGEGLREENGDPRKRKETLGSLSPLIWRQERRLWREEAQGLWAVPVSLVISPLLPSARRPPGCHESQAGAAPRLRGGGGLADVTQLCEC